MFVLNRNAQWNIARIFKNPYSLPSNHVGGWKIWLSELNIHLICWQKDKYYFWLLLRYNRSCYRNFYFSWILFSLKPYKYYLLTISYIENFLILHLRISHQPIFQMLYHNLLFPFIVSFLAHFNWFFYMNHDL